LGISKQYDLYFWNSVDISTGNGSRTKFSAWLQKTLARVAGWKYVESQYVARLESNFSEMELQELLDLYQNTKWLRHFVFLKPLLGLVFNSQKCCHTFVNWY
jgi:hypothetical protein